VSGEDVASAGWEKGPMDTFSDGGFAIAILVLEITVPLGSAVTLAAIWSTSGGPTLRP
jgi:uncharacterized membrane protein